MGIEGQHQRLAMQRTSHCPQMSIVTPSLKYQHLGCKEWCLAMMRPIKTGSKTVTWVMLYLCVWLCCLSSMVLLALTITNSQGRKDTEIWICYHMQNGFIGFFFQVPMFDSTTSIAKVQSRTSVRTRTFQTEHKVQFEFRFRFRLQKISGEQVWTEPNLWTFSHWGAYFLSIFDNFFGIF